MFFYTPAKLISIRGDDAGEPLDAANFAREAAAWAKAGTFVLGTEDRWTERAVARHLAVKHPEGLSASLADDLAKQVREVMRWRRWLAAMGGYDGCFEGGRNDLHLERAVRRARGWIQKRPDHLRKIKVEETIVARGGGWIVTRPKENLLERFFLSDVTWRGPTREAAEAQLSSRAAYVASKDAWIDDVVVAERRFQTDVTGIEVRVSKGAGRLLRARLMDGETVVGEYCLTMASRRACDAMGGPCLSGSRGMNEAYVGRGFGDAMHAAVEACTDLPLVPHGLNGNDGSLTRHSTRYYAKRVARGIEGAFSDEVADRFAAACVHDAEAVYLNRSERALTNARVVVTMRRMLGGTLRVPRGPEGEARLDRMWLSLPGGVAVTAAGHFVEADLLDALDVAEPDATMSRVETKDLRRIAGQRVLWGEGCKRDGLAALAAAHVIHDAGLNEKAPPTLDPETAARGRNPLRDEVMKVVEELRPVPAPR